MIDIFRLTPEQLERYIHLQSIYERQQAAADKVIALREYYSGDHPVMLTDRQKEFLGDLTDPKSFTFAHNLVRAVVDTLSERLSVTGFTVNGTSADDDPDGNNADAQAARALWAWWKDARLDLLEQELYLYALRDRTAYIMVDYDAANQRPRFVVHPVDDGKTGVMLHKSPDDPSVVLFASRYWWTFDPLQPGTTGIARKTVYLPREIRKYERQAGDWRPVQEEGDPTWPLPWVDGAGQPLGVAVVEFANPGGQSEMEAVIGVQNALNKAWLDLVAAADSAGFPILVAEYSDPNSLSVGGAGDGIDGGDETPIAPGRMLEIGGGAIRRIEAANLSPMLDVIWALTAAIAGVSRTPQYYLRPVGGGDVPSGEALKQLESGLVARAVKRQRVWGQAWEDAMRLAMRVADAFGPGLGVAPDAQIGVVWADPNTRNELASAQMAQIHKALGVPDAPVWEQLGYSPEQIAEFRAAANADKAAQVAGIAAALRTQQTGANNGGAGNAVQGAGNTNRGVAQ